MGEACDLIVDCIHARVLRSVHWPRSLTLCRVESPGAAVSPIWKPKRVSLTSADGVEGVSETYCIPLPGIPLWTRKGGRLKVGAQVRERFPGGNVVCLVWIPWL